ncbi:ABC transporter substrate-binding protein [Kiloniella sp. EL199]|uniref:ABC transporter substrate-binding protein n=1 Tax=Kiloniella sp. EL199 TaxID=2107581 RepID=UPI000EA30833|nr:ABC transporter substrate-binding protein [Kiloniella sp. EL199]
MKQRILAATLALAAASSPALAEDSVFVGHLVDYTGPTSFVSKFYGPGVRDAVDYINSTGGIDGTKIEMETIDYAYKVPQAIANYKKWKSKGMIALQGWGTGDTEALISFVAKDQVPVWSASYSGHLTDPMGKNPKTKKPAPYNFFYGPSYTDACRALVQWAAGDAKEKGISNPKFVHTGDNHPYPNAPKEGCGEYAAELGLEVLPPVVVPLGPGDFKAQCLTIKESGANYAYVGNLGGSVISLLKSCNTVGADVTYMGNVWAGDYLTIQAAEAKDYVFPTATPFWDAAADGMALVYKIADESGFSKDAKPTHHYIRGVCSAYYMKEAMEWAKANGGLTGENIKKGMYVNQNWTPKGLEGVCLPSSWSPEDHRGSTVVSINKGSFEDGAVNIERIAEMTLPRRDDWVGY